MTTIRFFCKRKRHLFSTWLLKMASRSIPLVEVIRRCIRGGSGDKNSNESEDDISDSSEESGKDLE